MNAVPFARFPRLPARGRRANAVLLSAVALMIVAVTADAGAQDESAGGERSVASHIPAAAGADATLDSIRGRTLFLSAKVSFGPQGG